MIVIAAVLVAGDKLPISYRLKVDMTGGSSGIPVTGCKVNLVFVDRTPLSQITGGPRVTVRTIGRAIPVTAGVDPDNGTFDIVVRLTPLQAITLWFAEFRGEIRPVLRATDDASFDPLPETEDPAEPSP
jgi:hypothetical protein